MNLTRKRKIRHAATIIIISIIASIFFRFTAYHDTYERKTVDMRTKFCRKAVPIHDDIAIILIDEPSLQALNEIAGRWPWPRYIHAELIDYLTLCGVESVVMDILFTENQLKHTSEGAKISEDDLRLAASTKNAGNVIHATELVIDDEDEVNKELLNIPLPESFKTKFEVNIQPDFIHGDYNVAYLPFRQLYEASDAIGIVTFNADPDHVNRGEHLLFNYQGSFFPSHGLAPILKRLDYETVSLKKKSFDIIQKDGTTLSVPLTDQGKYYVNIYGQYINTYSYSGVIESMIKIQNGITEGLKVPPDELNGKIIFVGASASATYDLKNTAIGKEVPGVFLHASVCGNLLSKDFLRFTGFFVNFPPFIIFLALTVFSILFMKKALMQIYFPIVLLALHISLSIILFNFNIVIELATPLFFITLTYFTSFTYISFTEGKEKRKVKNILGQYVSPAMLSEVLENSSEEYLKAEVGTKENLTVFFSDIRGFTTISERFPVEKVVETLNGYLSRMVDIIFEHSGTLDKFIGDAIVAFWGAPVRFDDHATKAVQSAVYMIEALEDLNQSNRENDLPELKIGIGIHTDNVILGNIGSTKKLDYTVIGDGVNLTSRLEGLTKNYGVPILISQATYEQVKERFCCRIVDYVRVKGKDEPIIIYEVLGETKKLDPTVSTIASLTDQGFEYYKNKQFEEAIDNCNQVLKLNPEDKLVKIFTERCRTYMKNSPPDHWDGCYTHTSK